MRFKDTLSQIRICFLIFRAFGTLSGQDVKNWIYFCTNYTFDPIKEGGFERAISDVMIPDIPLVVLFNQVINVLISKNPSVCVNIRLINCWGKNGFGLTFSVNSIL